MPVNHNIEKKVDEALNSLDGIQKVGANPFFFTRLQARLTESDSSGWERIGSFISRPAIAFLVVSLIVLINSWALMTFNNSSKIPKAISQQTDQLSTEEYALAANNYYIDENP